MFAPAGRITARASRLCRLAALVVRRQALAPWNPKEEGRGRAGLKNRQDTFFDAPPTCSRLTAPPKNSPPGRGGVCPARGFAVTQKLRVTRTNGFPLWGKLSPKVTDEGATSGHFPLIRRVPRHLPPRGKAFPSRIKPCPRGGHTTFIIYYLLSLIY